MDFLALPRRDLQALCKRNGVRANMASAAMADALRALPKIDGIEEYVKQPVPAPEPEVEAAVEEQNIGNQGSPLLRSRRVRVAAKSSEPIGPEEDNEEEKGNPKRQSNKEDAQALGVGRRGASRRARPVPVVPQPTAAVVEEASQVEDDLKREAERDNAPAPVVGRRGASRRARPSPAPAAPAAESEVPGAEEEQREVVEDLKRDASMDDAPAVGVGRRGPSRRARPTPPVAALAGKVVAEEEQRAPIRCGRRVKATGSSTEPIRLDDSDGEEKEDAKPQEDAQILGVGRRGGAGRRAQAEPVVAAPEAKAEEKQRAPIPRGRGIKAKSNELTRLEDRKEEKKEDTKMEEETGDVPAIGVGRRGASHRAPAPSEAPATRRSAAASKAEEGDVAVEAVPIRATRQRKPTLKAAAAAAVEDKAPRRATRRGALLQQEVPEEPQAEMMVVGAPDMAADAVPIRATRHRKPTMKAAAAAATAQEKAPPRATRRGAVTRTVLQPMVQEERQEAVGAPVSHQQCDAMDELEEASDPQKEELNEDEDEDVAIIEDEKSMEETPAEEPSATDHGCTDKSEMEEQQVDVEKCDAPLATQEESPILGLDSMVTEQASEDDESANSQDFGGSSSGLLDKGVCEETYDAVEEMELVLGVPALQEPSVTDHACMNKSEMQEQQVDYEKCHAPLANQEESPILGLVSMVTEQASEDDESANFQDDGGPSSVLLDRGVCEETYDADEEMELVLGIRALHAPLTTNESDVNHESEIGSVREEISEVDTDDDEVCKVKEHMNIAELQANIVDEATFLECSSNIIHVAGEETNEEVNIEDGLSCQEEGDVVVDKVLHSVDDTILLDCSSDISWIQVENAGNITSEMPENQAALDEVVIVDSLSQATVTDEVIQEEKGVLITDEMPQGTADMYDIEDNEFETVFVQVDQVVTAEMEVNTEDGLSYQVEGDVVVDKVLHDSVDSTILLDCSSDISSVRVGKAGSITGEMHENQAALDEDGDKPNGMVIGDSMSQATVTNEVVQEEKGVLVTDEMPQGTAGMHDMEDDQFETVLVQVDQEVTADMEVNTEDSLSSQDEGDLVVDKVLLDSVDNTILLDCSSDISQLEVEKAGNIISEMPENQAALDDDGDKLTGEVIGDIMSQATVTDEVVQEEKGVLITDEIHQGTAGMHDIEDDQFETVFVQGDQVVTADNLSEQLTDCEITMEENASLIVDEKQHSTVTVDGVVVFDHFKTDTAHADEQKEVIGIVTEVLDEIIGTIDEVVEEKVTVITEEMPTQGTVPNITDTMDECLKENHFGTDFGHDNEQKKAITATIEPEVSNAQDAGAQKENALLDDVTESLSKSIITMEPSVCKNSNENNSAEPMAVKVASESEDLTKLSLGQLRAKLKEKLDAKKNKEAKKRVALARVDENVCRSHTKGQ